MFYSHPSKLLNWGKRRREFL